MASRFEANEKTIFDLSEGHKTNDDEVVMVGVRMTKRHRKLLIHMSTEMELTMQEVVRRALAAYRESQSPINPGK